jgi:hypothetical protein
MEYLEIGFDIGQTCLLCTAEVSSVSERLPSGSRSTRARNKMKKWLLIGLTLVILSGCSWNKVWKWFDELEFERDDQTVRIVDIFTK